MRLIRVTKDNYRKVSETICVSAPNADHNFGVHSVFVHLTCWNRFWRPH